MDNSIPLRALCNLEPPVCGIPYRNAQQVVRRWANKQHLSEWNLSPGNIHGKRMVIRPSKKLAEDLIRLSRPKLRKVIGFLTGHAPLRKHLHTMGIHQISTLCRLCEMEDETATHLIFECEALARSRANIFGSIDEFGIIPQDNLTTNVLELVERSKVFVD